MQYALLAALLLLADAALFTRNTYCESKSARGDNTTGNPCREVLSGLVHLDHDQAFEFETLSFERDVNGTGTDVEMSLKVEKSPLLIVYNLEFQKDVPAGFAESAIDYTWSTAPSNGAWRNHDFERGRCRRLLTGDHPMYDAVEDRNMTSILDNGRVCACTKSGYLTGDYSDTKRATQTCNSWSALFKPGSSVWATRFCPSLVGPYYAAYQLTSWRWEFQIRVTLEWTPRSDINGHTPDVTVQRMFNLNWTQPEFYDEEFDFTFRMLFSVPQSGAQPPDLSRRYMLLVPKTQVPDDFADTSEVAFGPHIRSVTLDAPPTQSVYITTPDKDVHMTRLLKSNKLEDEPTDPDGLVAPPRRHAANFSLEYLTQPLRTLNARRSTSLLVPWEEVDLSGRTCDKVGVSLSRWAQEMGVPYSHFHDDADYPKWLARHQFCMGRSGDCLRNQPMGLLRADHERIVAGENPRYLLNSRTLPGWSPAGPFLLSGTPNLLEHRFSDTPNATLADEEIPLPDMLAWPTAMSHSTSLELILNATEISYMERPSRGTIQDIGIATADLGKKMLMTVRVHNEDIETSRFTLGSSPCTPILPQDEEMADELSSSDMLIFEPDLRAIAEAQGEEITPEMEAEWLILEAKKKRESPLQIAPVSHSLPGLETVTFVLTAERTVSWRKTQYQCTIRLHNAKGASVDERPVLIEFEKREIEISAVATETPPAEEEVIVVSGQRNVDSETFIVDEDVSLWARLRTAVASAFSWGPTTEGEEGTCGCRWYQPLCSFTNIWTCISSIRQMIVMTLTGFLAIGTVLVCGPTLLRCCCGTCSCLSFIGRRWKKAAQRSFHTGKNDLVCGSGLSSMPTAENTPANVETALKAPSFNLPPQDPFLLNAQMQQTWLKPMQLPGPAYGDILHAPHSAAAAGGPYGANPLMWGIPMNFPNSFLRPNPMKPPQMGAVSEQDLWMSCNRALMGHMEQTNCLPWAPPPPMPQPTATDMLPGIMMNGVGTTMKGNLLANAMQRSSGTAAPPPSMATGRQPPPTFLTANRSQLGRSTREEETGSTRMARGRGIRGGGTGGAVSSSDDEDSKRAPKRKFERYFCWSPPRNRRGTSATATAGAEPSSGTTTGRRQHLQQQHLFDREHPFVPGSSTLRSSHNDYTRDHRRYDPSPPVAPLFPVMFTGPGDFSDSPLDSPLIRNHQRPPVHMYDHPTRYGRFGPPAASQGPIIVEVEERSERSKVPSVVTIGRELGAAAAEVRRRRARSAYRNGRRRVRSAAAESSRRHFSTDSIDR